LADAIGDRGDIIGQLKALAEDLAESLQHWGGQGTSR
jgi:hypothetical protein